MAKEKKAKAPKAKKAPAEMPRGFKSDDAKKRLEQARGVLAKQYPKMTAGDRDAYLMEVGGNRYMALHAYAKKQ